MLAYKCQEIVVYKLIIIININLSVQFMRLYYRALEGCLVFVVNLMDKTFHRICAVPNNVVF